MLRIIVLLTLVTVFVGCYPPAYYDYWNSPSKQRYLDWVDQYDQYDSYSPYVYYNPYYYPYSFLPFFFSFSYSSDHFDYPRHRFYRGGPYDNHHYRGWWRR
jgi:hypothetical protein